MPDKKKIDISLLFYFSLRHAQKSKDSFSKLHKFQLNLFIFTIKSHFPTFSSSDQSQNENFHFYFFPSDEAQNTIVGARRPNNIVRAAFIFTYHAENVNQISFHLALLLVGWSSTKKINFSPGLAA